MDKTYESLGNPFGDGEVFYHLGILATGEQPLPLSGDVSFSARYGYDHVGNRVRETVGKEVTEYEYYPHSDSLWKKGDITFTYDANGNLIEKDTPEGRWNYLSRRPADRFR